MRTGYRMFGHLYGATYDITTSPVRASKHVEAPVLMKVMACSCSSDKPCPLKNCSCLAAGVSCTTFCKCEANTDQCQNTFTGRCLH